MVIGPGGKPGHASSQRMTALESSPTIPEPPGIVNNQEDQSGDASVSQDQPNRRTELKALMAGKGAVRSVEHPKGVGGSGGLPATAPQVGVRSENRSQLTASKKRLPADADTRTKAMNAAVRTKQCGPSCQCHAQSLSQMRDSANDASEHRVLLTLGEWRADLTLGPGCL